jgi:hypothetical protein
MATQTDPTPPDLTELVNDSRRLCQERQKAHSIAAARRETASLLLGGCTLIIAIGAVFIEAKAGVHSVGAWAALIAAILAITDVYLELPKRARRSARASDRFGHAERRIAAILARMPNVSPVEQGSLEEQARNEIDAAQRGAPLIRQRLLDEAKARINAMGRRLVRARLTAAPTGDVETWQIEVATQYQKAVDLLVGLGVGSLVLPPLFLTTYLGVTTEPIAMFLNQWSYWSAICFVGVVAAGITYHLVLAHLAKVAAGGPALLSSTVLYRCLVGLMVLIVVAFLAGLALFLEFVMHS